MKKIILLFSLTLISCYEQERNCADFKTGKFGDDYGLTITTGPLAGLHSRAVVVIDENGHVSYTEQVGEIANEPTYSF